MILDLHRLRKGVKSRIHVVSVALKKSGGFWCLANVGVTLSGILKMTHLDRVIKIYPTALSASEDSRPNSGRHRGVGKGRGDLPEQCRGAVRAPQKVRGAEGAR